MITAHALSGLGGKAPACFLVETPTARFLLDLGEGAPGHFPDLSGVGSVDAILISHGHADHIGGLHLAGQVGDPPIYATAMTRAFAGHEKLAQALTLPLQGRIEIAGVVIETGRAGHAAGGVWMRIGGAAGVLYSGDLCRESLLYEMDEPLRAKTLIVDASYGDYDVDIDDAVQALVEMARRGALLLPLPPTGRGVEIAVLMHEAGIALFVCPQHRRAAQLMAGAEEGTLVAGGHQRIGAMLASAGPLTAESASNGVMIAGNGAASAGVSAALLKRVCDDRSARILLTGHVEEGTRAKAALTTGHAQFMRWNVHPRRSDIAWLRSVIRPQTTLYAFCDDVVARRLAEVFD